MGRIATRPARARRQRRGRESHTGDRPIRPADGGGSSGAAHGAAGAEREALAATHWFDSGTDGQAYTATIRFRGQRSGVRGKPAPHETFVKDEIVPNVVPGSGPVSVTTHVYGLAPGEWTVTAELLPAAGSAGSASSGKRSTAGRTLPRARWSWAGWSLGSAPFQPVRTRWAPTVRLTRQPAVVPGSWSGLVGAGVIFGLVLQSILLAGRQVPIAASLGISVIGLLAGLAGAKAWYVVRHPRVWRDAPGEGWSVDGFLVTLPLVVVAGLLISGIPIGLFLDASAPALYFGVAIGRLGCFLTGCCAGRCTRARWGVWSSDRRVGARRIPTQLLESATGLAIGAVTLVLFLAGSPAPSGLLFVGALVVYSAARRILLGLRAER